MVVGVDAVGGAHLAGHLELVGVDVHREDPGGPRRLAPAHGFDHQKGLTIRLTVGSRHSFTMGQSQDQDRRGGMRRCGPGLIGVDVHREDPGGPRRLAPAAVSRKVDVRLPGNGNSSSHGARPVHRIITMI